MKKFLLFFLLLGALIFNHCGDDGGGSTVDCTGVVATYNSSVKFILDANCATPSCHTSISKAGQIDLSGYTQVNNYLKSSSAKFICSINHDGGCKPMPNDILPNKMDPALIKTLTCWINNGYPQ